MKIVPLSEMETFDPKTQAMNVIVECPRSSPNKYTYLPELDIFELSKALPAGCSFPHDFGFIPSTNGEDGDPLDVLVLLEEPVYPGTLVRSRIIGAIEANQTEDGKTVRNDRLIAVSIVSKTYGGITELSDLYEDVLAEIEHFFISYNEAAGKTFKVIGHANAKEGRKLVEKGMKRFEQQTFGAESE